MSSRRSIRTGRTCQKIGHHIRPDYLVCTRCHRSVPEMKRGDSKVFRKIRPKHGPWSVRLFHERRVPRTSKQKTMCHDCAFRPGSPERADAYGVWSRILRGVAENHPFFCHQTMPTDRSGSYCPKQNQYGHAIGHPFCAGWIQEHKHYHRPGYGLHSKFVMPSAEEIEGNA